MYRSGKSRQVLLLASAQECSCQIPFKAVTAKEVPVDKHTDVNVNIWQTDPQYVNGKFLQVNLSHPWVVRGLKAGGQVYVSCAR